MPDTTPLIRILALWSYRKTLFKEQCLLHIEDTKWTYSKIEDLTIEKTLNGVYLKLRLVLLPFKIHGLGLANVAEPIIRDSKNAVNKGQACNFYFIWKLHKAATFGLRTRPIAAALDYVNRPASHFLHCQLKNAVWIHPHVFKDSLEPIRIVRELQFGAEEQIMFTAADVNALYGRGGG
jgi:hypothetical protein